MKIGVLTLDSFRRNAERIGGRRAQVSTTGPVYDAPELLMVFLHPSADGRAWLNDRRDVVYDVNTIRELPLDGAVIFLGVCYGLENTAILDALWEAGAAYILAGPGANYGGSAGVLAGADVMAKAFRSGMETGMRAPQAYRTARLFAAAAETQGVPFASDALNFQMLRPPVNGEKSPSADDDDDDDDGAGAVGRQMIGVVGGLLAFLTLCLTLILGGGTVPLTTFSSIPAPPPGVTVWEKRVFTTTEVLDWWETPVVVTSTSALTIVDQISASAAFTLTETWASTQLSLTGYSSSAGTVTMGTGELVWVVASPGMTETLTKTWGMTGSWFDSSITELLETGDGETTVSVAIQRADITPTPTPTMTPSPTPTQTPQPKPTRIDPSVFYASYATPEVYITPYATPYHPERAVVLFYLPLVTKNYGEIAETVVLLPTVPEVTLAGASSRFGGQALDYTLTMTGTGTGTHTIIFTLPDGTTLVSATLSGYTQSGFDPIRLTWIEDDVGVWGAGTIRLISPEVTTTTTITATARVLWEIVQVSDVVTTTIAP